MTITTVDMANKAKEILGGEPSQVNVKNKSPVLLPRTPILLSSNSVIWDHFPNEANPLRNRMFMFSGLKELKWLQDVTKFPTPEYWQGIFAKIRTFEKEMNMTIDDIRETDLEPSLDALLNDAFKLADTIIERSCDEDSDNYQCGQRQYDSDKDSSNTMPLLTMEDIRSMSDMDTGDQSPEPSDPAHSPTRPGCGFPHGNNFCDSHRRQYEYEKAKQERARAKLTARNRYLRRTLRSE
ncbi:hypothetical protein DPMN_074660 [Dreissena polymorpha]|uniref:Parvovirus non-structural protein 1 helicase domain-containing protein n=1 Tax=Dreissena polymorpha TaxID=45954 RepID=A0A9D3YI49_DREPO|nr:hypothetical protein DPMN_074660 [Dreissena polymorpha]